MMASFGKSRRSEIETLGEIGDSENLETHNFGTHEMTKSERRQNPRFLSTVFHHTQKSILKNGCRLHLGTVRVLLSKFAQNF